VTTAPDGLSAFVALQTATPDLIILDIGLPYINGMDLCAAIRRIPTYSHIPVIIVTGSHKQIDATMANSYGAVGYFTKPYDDAELLAAINSCLASVN
jgi:twitching motility two-component system response regulator PilG